MKLYGLGHPAGIEVRGDSILYERTHLILNSVWATSIFVRLDYRPLFVYKLYTIINLVDICLYRDLSVEFDPGVVDAVVGCKRVFNFRREHHRACQSPEIIDSGQRPTLRPSFVHHPRACRRTLTRSALRRSRRGLVTHSKVPCAHCCW